jgi:hypothetical protein
LSQEYYIKDTLKGNVVHFLSFPKNNIDINVQICPVYFDGVAPLQFSNNSSKFIWLLTNENLTVLKELG